MRNLIFYTIFTSRKIFLTLKIWQSQLFGLFLHKNKKRMAIDKVKYWKELADYDIETAEVMYNGGRWLYVGFMCHLVMI